MSKEIIITKSKFNEYVWIQDHGICNMVDYKTISNLTSLTRDEHREIIKNYFKYAEKYLKEGQY